MEFILVVCTIGLIIGMNGITSNLYCITNKLEEIKKVLKNDLGE